MWSLLPFHGKRRNRISKHETSKTIDLFMSLCYVKHTHIVYVIHETIPIHPLHPGNEDVVRTLLSAGALINARDDKSSTPLHSACMRGNVAAIRQGLKVVLWHLLKNGPATIQPCTRVCIQNLVVIFYLLHKIEQNISTRSSQACKIRPQDRLGDA